MSDENLSITDTEKNRRISYKFNNPLAEAKWILVAIGVNALIFLMTYSNPSRFTNSDGDAIRYLLYALAFIGFTICNETIKLIFRSRGESLEDDESGIDAEFMGTYKYTSFQDQKWFVWILSAAAGGLNVIIYLGFLAFVTN